MIYSINETHDPNLKSWLESANEPGCDFPIQNLPFCIFRKKNTNDDFRAGIAIGDQILDISRCGRLLSADNVTDQGLLDDALLACCGFYDVNDGNQLISMSQGSCSILRRQISSLLRSDNPALRDKRVLRKRAFVQIADAEMQLPAHIGDYTDFYASIFHATNVGKMMRPDNPLLPNYKYVPIAYHGRASSVVVSGTSVYRPKGQTKSANAEVPTYGLSRSLDYEVEVGFFVGKENALGQTIRIDEAENHIFGLCLVNDWSARDVQGWEYQPLGPFLAKNFATTISPWIVTLEALAPYRISAFARAAGDPEPLDYLNSAENRERGGIDLKLEVLLASQQMREQGMAPLLISHQNFRNMYWTMAQMLTHHASNGCNLQPGDLIASGTVSGPEKENRGCLLELTWRGTEPIELPTGESRRWLEDGDEVIIRGWCEREGFVRIGFGECRGIILPAKS
jgi:fumarylacetoacetase